MSQSTSTSTADNNIDPTIQQYYDYNTSPASTLEEALEKTKELRSKLAQMQLQKDKATKELAKIQKEKRMLDLKLLVPRELFRTEDRYNEELEKVYSWQGMCDNDIADIYRAKLRAIDLGKSRANQHSAATAMRDPYANFRDVPNFFEKNGHNNSSNNDVMNNYYLMKRIVGNGGNYYYSTAGIG